MVRALGKGFAVAAVAAVAWLLFSVESFVFSLWAFDRHPVCHGPTAEVCARNGVGAFLVSAIVGLEALVGTASAGVLVALGKLNGARITACLLIGLLAVQHIWLLV